MKEIEELETVAFQYVERLLNAHGDVLKCEEILPYGGHQNDVRNAAISGFYHACDFKNEQMEKAFKDGYMHALNNLLLAIRQ